MVSENEIHLSQHVDLVNMETDLFLLLTNTKYTIFVA